MNIVDFTNITEMAEYAASIVIAEATRNPKLLLCTASGSSPLPLYERLTREAQKNTQLFRETRVIPLDEWVGLPAEEGSCHAYLKKHILIPLQISKDRYYGFDPAAENLEEECGRIQNVLEHQGPIGICVLGLGKNGHLGFNEPADVLHPYCHIMDLAAQTQQHIMIADIPSKPTKGLTLGMNDILSSKRIVLLVSGKGKEEAKQKLRSAEISSQCPATFLWLHNNVDCLVVD
ncbi:galactosamine-6-phosphate isomerase [Flavobacteriaceae bacterium]|nr:galactosamine-6-phosphate isomerase [Flavobacteriaceae bacterium]